MSYYQVKAGVQKPQHFERKRKAGTSQRQRLRLCRCEDTPRQQRPTQGISAGTRGARPALRIYRLLRCPPARCGFVGPHKGGTPRPLPRPLRGQGAGRGLAPFGPQRGTQGAPQPVALRLLTRAARHLWCGGGGRCGGPFFRTAGQSSAVASSPRLGGVCGPPGAFLGAAAAPVCGLSLGGRRPVAARAGSSPLAPLPGAAAPPPRAGGLPARSRCKR